MIREPVAIGSWLLLALLALLPARMRWQAPVVDLGVTAAAFFVAAALTRYWLRETRTREQILAFVVAAAAVAIVRAFIEGRALSPAGFAAGSAGTIAGALLVKFGLEGLPF